MDSQPDELDQAVIDQMVLLKEEGEPYAEKGLYRKAIEYYRKAYELLPIPREKWEAATWILGIIGDAFFLNRDYAQGFDAMNQALLSPGGMGNPFIHLRIGECAFEIGEMELAKDNLMRAYMGAGEEIFLHDNPKYLGFLAKHANIKIKKHFERKRFF
jgi:tetratricopeptide (TPR) repeat protein